MNLAPVIDAQSAFSDQKSVSFGNELIPHPVKSGLS